VARNKIKRDVVLRAVLNENINPCGLSGCGTSHAKPGIALLDGAGRVIVKLPVSYLFWVARPKIEIGLIPNFEVPACDFVDAIAVD
jgi:hypothetical protein